MNAIEIRARLVNALSTYDRKQSTLKHHNPYALGQYFARLDDVMNDIEAGATPRQALCAGFCDRVLDACLRAIGEPLHAKQELGTGWYYKPAVAKEEP
jgi:hypothetical protein